MAFRNRRDANTFASWIVRYDRELNGCGCGEDGLKRPMQPLVVLEFPRVWLESMCESNTLGLYVVGDGLSAESSK